MHVDSLEAPSVSLHLPASHKMHVVFSELAYLPTEQLLQLAPAVMLTCPAVQSLQTRAPMAPDICLPASQTAHTVLLFAPSVYFPGSQSSHDNALGDAVNVSTGQSTHVNALKYFPALQGISAICPGAARLEFPPIPSEPFVISTHPVCPTAG